MSDKDFKPYKPLKERRADLPESILQVIQKLPEEEQENAARILLAEYTEIYAESFAGPLPPPSVLEEYNRIVPGSAKTFIDSLQNQTKSRVENEIKITSSNVSIAKRGQILAFIIVILILGLSAFFEFTGHSAYAITLASTTIIGLAISFISGRYYQFKDLKEGYSIE